MYDCTKRGTSGKVAPLCDCQWLRRRRRGMFVCPSLAISKKYHWPPKMGSEPTAVQDLLRRQTQPHSGFWPRVSRLRPAVFSCEAFSPVRSVTYSKILLWNAIFCQWWIFYDWLIEAIIIYKYYIIWLNRAVVWSMWTQYHKVGTSY